MTTLTFPLLTALLLMKKKTHFLSDKGMVFLPFIVVSTWKTIDINNAEHHERGKSNPTDSQRI